MDQPHFNLLEEPWLLVTWIDGSVSRVGLAEAFERSAEIRELADTTPPALVAQYRLLLAILHRALEHTDAPRSPADQARWLRYGLPIQAVRTYLARWRDHFYLFHPERPFMQVAELATAEITRDRFKPWTQLSLASANGNTPMVFDHSCDVTPSAISPADALTTLLGYLQFTPGGLVKVIRSADKAGPLVNTAAILPLGETLSATLTLGLHPRSAAGAEPDLPAWEQKSVTLSQLAGDPTFVTGPNDRYTRLSRAVLLHAEADGRVRWVRFAAGLALADDPQAPDPMASYRVGSNGLVRLTFVEGRALWRDLAALMPAASQDAQPAAVLEYALEVRSQLEDDVGYQPLLVAGVASDQAKVLRWRAEQLRLPVALLRRPDPAGYLLTLLERAETVHGDLRKLATLMLAQVLPTPDSRETWSRAAGLLKAGPFSTTYFATAERSLSPMLDALATDRLDAAEALWTRTLRDAAHVAWQQVLKGMGVSAKALRAHAMFWPRFQHVLRQRLPLPEQSVTEEA